MNELLFIAELLAAFSFVYLIYGFFSADGLYVWAAVAGVIANIQAAKCIEIFGLSATLGNAVYASVFLTMDIITEKLGVKRAGKAVLLSFFMYAAFAFAVFIATVYVPSAADKADGAMRTLFRLSPRIFAGSLAAYLISSFLDVHLFDAIRRRLPSVAWFRSFFSTFLSQAVDSIVFVSAAFFGVYEMKVLLSIMLSTYVLKVFSAGIAVPFFCIVRKKYL